MRLALPRFMRLPLSLRISRSDLRRCGWAAAMGAGVALGQVPFGLWFVALPALCAVLVLVARARPALTAFAAGFGYAALSMFWIVEPFMVEARVYGWMAPFALILMAAGMGAFWALGAGIGARIGRGPTAQLCGIALGLVTIDAIRSYAFTGFPWVLFGHIWIGTPVAQAAALIGPIGLSALTLLMAVLALVVPRREVGVGLAALLLAVVWAGGELRQRAPDPIPPTAITLRLVQPNATQALKWDPDYALEFFYRHLDLTAQPPAEGKPKPDLIIWPETSVPFLLNDPGDGLDMIAKAAGGAPVALGIQRADRGRYYNSLVVIGPDGKPTHLYDKVHLVPFGEYVPFGDDLANIGISAFAAQRGNGYTKGAGETVFDLGRLGHVEPLICYESIFPQDIRRVATRPDWIMLVTNDAWFGDLSGPWQHLAQARLRAIEFGLPVARAANTGVSAMIDAKGRILAELGMEQQGVIDVPLPAPLPETIYAKTGDLPVLVLIVILFGLILSSRLNNRVDPMGRQV